jgi:hypothetical protein
VKSAITILAAALLCYSVHAQGTFQNLNFEQATPAQFSGSVSASSALPFWTPEIGGIPQSVILQNTLSTGAPEVTLTAPGGPIAALDGSFSVLLTASGETASISQTGLIPVGTASLFFEAQLIPGGPPNQILDVLIGSQTVPTVLVATESTYSIYGANISAWAGTTEELTFSAATVPSDLNIWEIDDISFSSTGVPEPDPFILTGLGGTLFALYRRFAPKRCS